MHYIIISIILPVDINTTATKSYDNTCYNVDIYHFHVNFQFPQRFETSRMERDIIVLLLIIDKGLTYTQEIMFLQCKSSSDCSKSKKWLSYIAEVLLDSNQLRNQTNAHSSWRALQE